MNQYIYCDFETQSAVNINDERYLTHESTRPLIFVWKSRESDKFDIYINPAARAPGLTPAERKKLKIANVTDKMPIWPKDRRLVAHNAEMFDEQIYARFARPHEFDDTLHLCNYHGIPGSLASACPFLGLGEKGDDTAMLRLCKAKYAKGNRLVYPTITADDFFECVKYCVQDVALLEKLHKRLLQFPIPDQELQLINVHKDANRRGFAVDLDYARKLSTLWDELAETAEARLKKATKGKLCADDMRSHQKVKAWLATQGNEWPTLNDKVVSTILDGTTSVKPAVREVLDCRRLVNRASQGKINAFIESADADSRVRRTEKYSGAHTHRMSARRVQHQNLYRQPVDPETPLTLKAIAKHAAELKISTADVLSGLTRGIIVAPDDMVLGIGDFAGIEARYTAWFAGCDKLLETFKRHGDPYCDFGFSVFGRKITKKDKDERFICKTAMLALQYQVGAPKLAQMFEGFGVDLHKAGISPKKLVDTYRSEFTEIKQLWSRCQNAALRCIANHSTEFVNGVEFRYDGECMIVTLPSGNALRYWKPVVRMEFPTAFDSPKALPHLYYWSAMGFEKNLYGGKLVENISQSGSRDIMADKAVKYVPNYVITVHDELVDQLKNPERIHKMARDMSKQESWYLDFPLAVEAFTSRRYSKQPPKNSISVTYANGKEIK